MDAKLIAYNTIGMEVKTIADVIKAQELGLHITDKEGNEYNYYVTYEDDNGDECEREPTDDEVFERISEDLKNGNQLYASMYLDGKKWEVNERKGVTLQSDFHVGQEIYIMRDNKITKDKILYINLVVGAKGHQNKYILNGAQGKYTDEKYIFATKEELVKSLIEED